MRLDEKATCSVYLIEIRLLRIVKDESKDYTTQTGQRKKHCPPIDDSYSNDLGFASYH
jgi:hypothetical protein